MHFITEPTLGVDFEEAQNHVEVQVEEAVQNSTTFCCSENVISGFGAIFHSFEKVIEYDMRRIEFSYFKFKL